jgi:predicted ATP-binding protein involved in virulence
MNLELETEDSSYSRNHSSFPDKHQSNIKSLSSGEKQIATLLYASHISSQEVILIDEPEISLHINWQRNLLKEIVSKIKNKQIIVCTHSPVIGTNFRESIQAMNISATNPETWVYTPDVLIPKEDNEDTDGKNYKKIEDTDKEEENYEDKKYYEEEE